MICRKLEVLVPIVLCLILGVSCISGCAGFAEPLPQISVAPNSVSMNTKVGSSSTQVATLTNVSTTGTAVSQATVDGLIAYGFSEQDLRAIDCENAKRLLPRCRTQA